MGGIMEFDRLLPLMVEENASDLFITSGMPPSMKVDGKIVAVGDTKLSPEQTHAAVVNLMNEVQREEFKKSKECNFAISARGVGRFRVSAFVQRNCAGMVLRRIETNVPSIDDLHLPNVIESLALQKRGLVIFVGATGTGKSTSLAALINHRSKNRKGHIITVEDPVEFMHQHQRSIVTQREVGLDTESYEIGLKNALRQSPDVIMIGEIRTNETMAHAITFAESGHLCLATLHANNANQALERIIHFFPPERHGHVWMDLSLNLKAIVAQQLIPSTNGGRCPAVEVLVNTPIMSDMIRKGAVHELKDIMSKPNDVGMATFDQSLFQLYTNGEITYDDALLHADSPNDLRLMIKLKSEADAPHLSTVADKLSLQNDSKFGF